MATVGSCLQRKTSNNLLSPPAQHQTEDRDSKLLYIVRLWCCCVPLLFLLLPSNQKSVRTSAIKQELTSLKPSCLKTTTAIVWLSYSLSPVSLQSWPPIGLELNWFSLFPFSGCCVSVPPLCSTYFWRSSAWTRSWPWTCWRSIETLRNWKPAWWQRTMRWRSVTI